MKKTLFLLFIILGIILPYVAEGASVIVDEDTFIYPNASPAPTDSRLIVGYNNSTSGEKRSLLKFDLTSTNISSLTEAYIQMYLYDTDYGTTNLKIHGYAPTRSWSEDTEVWPGPSYNSTDLFGSVLYSFDQQTWNDATSTGLPPYDGIWVKFYFNQSGLNKIQQWLDTPASNYGILLKSDYNPSVSNRRVFNSSNHSPTNQDNDPTLFLLGDEIPDETIPEPVSIVLLGLGIAGLIRKRIRQ